ncbi:HD family hydrolase [Pyrococcus furiosus DSM 3638]|uniref:5'-deoxynucleotidase n=3 Tax=Pyrococcus furiosus TaxID=2261 RepID=A0A5C0XNF4_PYRFU|nr:MULTISPECIES: HD family hydrolase [Pyrococcus]AAL80519.1 oxetanocin-like protein [Pyrococcus furiosus DSM 3638]AFN03185.1 oxetanocin-like protein [Pyrococcus furiosus COM1]MDK2869273.1 hypothetical protein [Pyrococcus sp.]QEK78111.1 HD family hydrolase [Pyrococcus furiosus DSM 3638]
MIDLILLAGKLKRIPRMGWLIKGVPNPESVADHSYRVAFITLLLAEELKKKGVEIDVEKALKIAIIHDLGEAIITDLPLSAQKYLNKEEAEAKALKDVLPEYTELFEEYSKALTLEGQLVKIADKLDMIIQAYEYELSGAKNLSEFWNALEDLEKLEISRYLREIIEEVRRLKDDH